MPVTRRWTREPKSSQPRARHKSVEEKVENDVLTIEGQFDFSKYEGMQPLNTEYNIGNYTRSFELSSKVGQYRESGEGQVAEDSRELSRRRPAPATA